MRWVRTRVLPLPAPASTSSGPSVDSTARRCSGFRPSRICAACKTPGPPRASALDRGGGGGSVSDPRARRAPEPAPRRAGSRSAPARSELRLHLDDVADLALAVARHDLVVALEGADQAEGARVVVLHVERTAPLRPRRARARVQPAAVVD